MLLTTNELVEATNEKVGELSSFIVSLRTDFVPTILDLLWKIVIALLIFFIGKIIIRAVRSIMNRNFIRSNIDVGAQQFIDSLLKFLLYAALFFIIFANFGVDTTSIAAIIASAGVAISLALQGTLSNFAGGVLILLTKPFVVGDYIIEDNNNNEGNVKEIKLFHTKLTTIENKTVVIPNSMLTNNSITNYTAKNERQLDLRVNVSYHADLKKSRQLIEGLLRQEERIFTEREMLVFVDALEINSVVIGLRAWVSTEDYWPVRWKLLEDMKQVMEKNGIEIPYQQHRILFEEYPNQKKGM